MYTFKFIRSDHGLSKIDRQEIFFTPFNEQYIKIIPTFRHMRNVGIKNKRK